MKQGMMHELFNMHITSVKKYSFDTLIKQNTLTYYYLL